MARNSSKYVYLTIGILRDSQLHKDLVADAEEHNHKQLPSLASLRLGDYYRMRRQGVALSVVQGAPMPAEEDKADKVATDKNEITEALSNAAEADDAWPD